MSAPLGLSWYDWASLALIGLFLPGLGLLAAWRLGQRCAPAAHAALATLAALLLVAPFLVYAGGQWVGQIQLSEKLQASGPGQETAAPPQSLAAGFPKDAAWPLTGPSGAAEPVRSVILSCEPANYLEYLRFGVIVLWLSGSVLLAAVGAAHLLAAIQLRRRMLPASPIALHTWSAIHSEAGLRTVSLAESTSVHVPVALGPLRPLIILPRDFANGVTEDELTAVLRHELGHFAAGHHTSSLLLHLARAAFWWNPLLWVACRWQEALQEEIADNFALGHAASSTGYATLLVRLATQAAGQPAPQMGLAIVKKTGSFQRRIESLLHPERKTMTHTPTIYRLGMLSAAVLLASGIALGTVRKLNAVPPEPTPASKPAEPARTAPQQRGQVGQSAGSFTTESFRNGQAEPISKPMLRRQPGKPPVIVYPGSRSSSAWITTGHGTQAAVDEGVEHAGRIAYLTLTFDLVVVDAKSKKTMWSTGIGAFWDTITFEDRAKPGQPQEWSVVLKSTRRPEFQQSYDLETGKKLELVGGPPAPGGKAFTPRKVWSGSAGVQDGKLYQVMNSAEAWNKARGDLFGAAAKGIPTAEEIDFSKERLLVCYGGKTTNWNGIRVELAVEDDQRVLLRLQRSTYQSMGDVGYEHPYGLIVLPKSTKPVILEYNMQGLIGGPPIWKEFQRLP